MAREIARRILGSLSIVRTACRDSGHHLHPCGCTRRAGSGHSVAGRSVPPRSVARRRRSPVIRRSSGDASAWMPRRSHLYGSAGASSASGAAVIRGQLRPRETQRRYHGVGRHGCNGLRGSSCRGCARRLL